MEKDFTLNRIQSFNKDGIKYLSIMYNDLAIMHFVKKEHEKAFNYFVEAMEYLDVLLNQQFVDNSGNNSDEIDNLQKQIEYGKGKILVLAGVLGDAKMSVGDFVGAKDIYEIALSYDQHNSFILFNLAKCLKELGAFNSASAFLKTSLELNPENYEAYKLLGDILYQWTKDFGSAIECYEKYLEKVKDDSSAYNALGYFYMELSMFDNLDKQVECFEKAVELDSKSRVAIRNLALVYPRIGRVQDAIECYNKLFKLGNTKKDLFNYGCLKLKMGDFKEGWKYYESRFEVENKVNTYPKFKQPKWNGKTNPNRILLIQSEQGFGDSIMFIRYLRQVKPMMKKVIFRVQDELVDLFKTSIPDMKIVGASTPIQSLSFDYHIPLLSLPLLLGAESSNIPLSEGYLSPDAEKVKKFKDEYFNNDYFKIGISWHGASHGGQYRNVPLGSFLPLANLKNVKIYSFQKEAEMLKNLPEGVEIVDLGSKFEDFSDTAAAMANVDLCISSDNCILNLAGALGKKAYLLLPLIAEWRWFFDEEITPWYKSVKIFRSKDESKSWSELIQKIMECLATENNITL